MRQVFIIGGGLAGLCSAIQLSKAGFGVTLAERKSYPFHRVCGEYISNESRPFLSELGFHPDHYGAAKISRLAISSVSGKLLQSPLDLGGFGLSRFLLDDQLYQLGKACGVKFLLHTKINQVTFHDNQFQVETQTGDAYRADLVIGAYGKRSNLDQKLNRPFFFRRSPYLGIKYHIKTDFASDLVQLDNFPGGYCGISKIEDNRFCLCYLSATENLKKHGSIKEMEEQVLFKNPFLKTLFTSAEFLWEQPEVINEISFDIKSAVEDHILMCGDAAGMITPLCGNGMAMAMHASKILSQTIIEKSRAGWDYTNRLHLEKSYQARWQQQFKTRLKTGRTIQRLFGKEQVSGMVINSLRHLPAITSYIVKSTHGRPF